MKPPEPNLITVCAACLCASCYQGELMCEKYTAEKIIQLPIGKLKKLRLEHSSWWKKEKKEARNAKAD